MVVVVVVEAIIGSGGGGVEIRTRTLSRRSGLWRVRVALTVPENTKLS